MNQSGWESTTAVVKYYGQALRFGKGMSPEKLKFQSPAVH